MDTSVHVGVTAEQKKILELRKTKCVGTKMLHMLIGWMLKPFRMMKRDRVEDAMN